MPADDDQPYSYFVSYAHHSGFGMAEVTRKDRVATYDHVLELHLGVLALGEVNELSIISYQLIHGPETP